MTYAKDQRIRLLEDKLDRAEAQNQRLRVDSKLDALNLCRDELLKAREVVRVLTQALDSWATYEEDEIKKVGPYVDSKIPRFIKQAREALALAEKVMGEK